MNDTSLHWNLKALNDRLHYIDAAEQELYMWRENYCKIRGFSDEEAFLFVSLPTQCYKDKTPNEVYEIYVKGNSIQAIDKCVNLINFLEPEGV